MPKKKNKYKYAYNSILLNDSDRCVNEKKCYDVDSNSWFDIKIHDNRTTKKSHSFENESSGFDTLKIEVELTKKQKDERISHFCGELRKIKHDILNVDDKKYKSR